MRHTRSDYNRIQDPLNLIPENEPVFLLRSADENAIATLIAYRASFAKNSSGSSDEKDFLDAIEHTINTFRNYQAQFKPKKPTHKSPAEQAEILRRYERECLQTVSIHAFNDMKATLLRESERVQHYKQELKEHEEGKQHALEVIEANEREIGDLRRRLAELERVSNDLIEANRKQADTIVKLNAIVEEQDKEVRKEAAE